MGKKTMMVVAMAVCVALFYFWLVGRAETQKDKARLEVERLAERANDGAPYMLDEITRLNRVTTDDISIHYYLTLLQVDADNFDDERKAALQRAVVSQYCEAYRPLFELGVTFLVTWTDTDEDTVLDLEIEPSDC